MTPDPQDTIVAQASASGPGGRAIVRLSGPAALTCVCPWFSPAEAILVGRRRAYSGQLRLPGIAAPLPADLYFWPAPRSYTGQEMVELHLLSCPPLVEHLLTQLLNTGARAAQPGEFTLRAFLAGKLDLPRAEAVLGIIEAGDRGELKEALLQLAGGLTRPLQGLRDDLLNLLADIEAGLDFTEEDIHFVGQTEARGRLAGGLAQVLLVCKQLEQRALCNEAVRVVLAGRPNAGKSSLFNALLGSEAALVSSLPGTTRDYLVGRLDLDGVAVELVDTAGWQQALSTIEEQAQQLGQGQARHADVVLVCVEAGVPLDAQEQALLTRPGSLAVSTKCDLKPAHPDSVATSARTGTGLADLRSSLARWFRNRRQPALAPSLSRCRHHVDACLAHLRRAHDLVLEEEPAELLALELRGALDELGALVGAVYTDDLLDRIFSRFCIGK
jgi:tRNA modification GTPase